MSAARQTAVGVTLALAVIGAWAAVHGYALFVHELGRSSLIVAPLLIAAACWLNVGLFIVAHDAMHGSLAPHRPGVNRAFGRVALGLYAGFWFDSLRKSHFEHHRRPGTDDDPDFSAHHRLLPWYAGFIRRYFGWPQLLVLAAATVALRLAGAPMANILLLWAAPAMLSSLQLFYFGTFLPHRAQEREFADDHRARSNEFGWLASLLSCYHFGYHHEHHLAPHVPWWRLPAERRSRATAR